MHFVPETRCWQVIAERYEQQFHMPRVKFRQSLYIVHSSCGFFCHLCLFFLKHYFCTWQVSHEDISATPCEYLNSDNISCDLESCW